ncbi:MAG: TetR/AcrR family transcriptional regulator [Aquihabitans sp.]
MARTSDPAVRAALIEAAARLLADDGLAALSIRRVAAEVGTSTMAVYTHFGSKDDLIAGVVREAFARLATELADEGTVSDDPVRDLMAAGAAYRRMALANPHLYRVMFGLNPMALGDPAAAALGDPSSPDAPVDRDAAQRTFEVLVDVMDRAVQADLVRGEPRLLAIQAWATMHGLVSLELAGFLGDRSDEAYAAITRTLAVGLGN